MNYNSQYKKALFNIYNNGVDVDSSHGKSKELLCYKIIINPNDNVIKLDGFVTNVNYANEELQWYYAGSNRIDFSDTIQKTWYKYSDDGVIVNSAYGYRIFGKHPHFVNQWDWVKEKLKQNQDTRQAIININSYFDKENETKDFPCTMDLHLIIRKNKLYWITHMRSQDIYYGMRNDIFCFTEMQKRMAKELNIKLGKYIHVCNSLHLYEKHYNKVEELIKKEGSQDAGRNTQ